MKNLFSIIISFTICVLIISGCASKAVYNAEVAKNLPKDVAHKYLSETRFLFRLDNLNRDSPPEGRCSFNINTMSAGISGQRPYGEFSVVQMLALGGALVIEHDGDYGSFIPKACVVSLDEKAAVKMVTALKSLGIKTPD